jgi:hypothetical protein
MLNGNELYSKVCEKLDTNAPTFGVLADMFKFSETGYNYIVRNRIKMIIRETINQAIDLAKQDVLMFMRKYWAQDSKKTLEQGINYIQKRRFTDISLSFGLFIGADEDYFQYVLSMAKRMHDRGKMVKWTNPLTRDIEEDIIGYTQKYASNRVKYWITEGLRNVNLGWMAGKGRIPKKVELEIEGMKSRLSNYNGVYKPLIFN